MIYKEAEKQLLISTSKGNKVAFHTLFSMHNDKIYSFAMYLTHTDFLAEEITQEVFIKIWTNREKLAEIESFNAYLRTIARNVASNYLKRIAIEKNVLKKLSEQELQTQNLSENSNVVDTLLRIHEEAIKLLSPQQQKVYILHHAQGLKNKEIAEMLNISVYTVKEYLKCASKSVRKYVGTKINLMVILALNIFFS